MKAIFNKTLNISLVLLALIVFSGNAWGTQLFHETFGDNSNSARAWSDSYSVKSGVTYVYSNVAYTMTNVKQGKNTTGETLSGLNQSSQGTDAVFQFGPLDVSSYESLVLTFYWKPGSTGGTYSRAVHYKIGTGSWTEVSKTSGSAAASTFYLQTYNLPAAAQVSNLYLKITFNTSNTQAIIDEVDLAGTVSGYAVTFANGGHGTAPTSPAYAKALTLSAITATGYTCTGWKANVDVKNTSTSATIAANTLIANGTNVTLSQATTFTAQWSANEYTVTLNDNGGSGGSGSKTVTYNASTNLTTSVTVPTRTHYDFAGYWTSTNSGVTLGTQLVNADGSWKASVANYTDASKNWLKASNVTLYAKWDEHALTNYHTRCLTVTYAAGLGSGTAPSSHERVNPNSSITLADNTFDAPTGMEFANWSDGTNTYNEGASYTVTANTTMTAQWSYKTYTITYYDLGSTSFTGSHASGYPTTHTYNTATALKTATKDGYTFGGWYTNSACTGDAVTSLGATAFTDNITLYAKWTQTVTLDKNGGSADGSTTATFNAGGPLTVTAPTRSGYTVEGYYAEAGCTNKVMTAAGALVNYSGYVSSSKWIHSGATTLYAKWTEDTHTVTVEAGANGSVDPTSVSGVGITTASGAIIASPNTGYHFDSWSIPSGVTIASGSTTSASITINATADGKTITASFAPNTNTPYTVKHYKQKLDGTYPSTPTETQNLTGTTATSVTPAVKSYTGFTAPSTQTVTILADGSRVVEYKYTRNSYTLTWALDGGSATGGTAAGSVKYEASLTAPTVTKTGYTFSSWSPSVPATMPAANSTYTAQWTPNTNTPYTVKHYKQKLDGTYDATPDDTDNLTGTTATSVTPARKSYTGFTAPSGQTVTILADGSRVVEYKYTRNSYTLTWSTDGDPLSGSYTNGSTKYGATITAPNTPTKANYVFAAWSPTPAATMPAANTTYTATWTAAVASVTAGGSTTYYTTLASAMTEAMKTDNSTIKILDDISGQAALTYNVAKKCTLDLNNHTVAGTVTKLLTINKAGANFIITDNSVGKGGALSSTAAVSGRAYGVYITNGTLNLKNGHISIVNTTASKTASGVYVSSGTTFIMDGGKVESEAPATAYGVHGVASTTSTITINGGEIYGHTNTSTEAVGLYTEATGLTVNGGTIKSCAHTKTSKGIYLYGGSATINGGYIEAITDTVGGSGSTTAYGIQVANKSPNIGSVNIPSTSTVSVNAVANTSTVYAIILGGGTDNNTIAGGSFIARAKTGKTAYGVNSSGTTTISGGTFKVITKTTTAYGIYSPRGTVTVSGSPVFNIKSGSSTAYGAFAYGTIGAKGMSSTKFSGTIIINGGTFNVTSTTTTAYGANAGLASLDLRGKSATNDTVPGMHYMPGIIEINDGTFNVTATTTGAYGVFVEAAKSESGTVGTTTRIPLGTITGGKFKVQSSSDANATAYAMNSTTTADRLVVEGGYYSTKRTNETSTSVIEDKYTSPVKSCNYTVESTTAADRASVGSDYLWKVGDFTNIFTDASNDHKWSTASNWSKGVLPTIETYATINKPCVVDVTDAQAKSVVLNQNGDNTGSLEISAGQELVVATTVRKTTDGSNRIATGEYDINFGSISGAGLGALVIGSHATANGLNNATVNFATLSNGETGSSASDAQYVGTPFSNRPAMLYQFYNSWMYKFINTGVPGWTRVNGEDGLDAFQGYCIFSADGTNHVYWMQGTLVASEDQIINLQYNGGTASDAKNENMLANSWMAPIKIAAFEASDFTNADATIYIYNTGSPDDYEKNGKGTGTLSGQYQVYTPGTAGTAIIPSMQAFSVYTSGSSPKITLDYSKLVYDPAAAGSVVPGPNKAPCRTGADELKKMHLYIGTESGYGDMLYMLESEDFADGFENGWDGRKMFGDEIAPQLYGLTPDGNMAINCVPTFEGQVLGFRKGTQDNVFTFTFEYEGENTWYLNDLKEQTSTLISSESTYMFMASDEDMAARFIISRTPIHYMPTGTEQSAISDQQSAVKKIVIDDKVFIIRNGQMYHVTGVMVR